MRHVHHRTRVCVLLLASIFVLGTAGFMATERLGAVDAAYFAVVTMSTVGFGDISPGTQAGKLVAVVFILAGVGSFMALIASATEDLLNSRDRRIRRDKCHMLAGLFFSEIGNELLEMISPTSETLDAPPDGLAEKDTWSLAEVGQAAEWLMQQEKQIDARAIDIAVLRDFLNDRTTLLLRLLENPALLENEAFTDVLRAVFHLREELAHRNSLVDLHEGDLKHLTGDIRRVFTFVVPEWSGHMAYLREHYPYLFSLAVRTNPVDGRADATVH